MKIISRISEDFYEGRMELELITDKGTTEISFGKGEPEDNCLARDLNDALSIEDMLVMAYEAGKAGEVLEQVTEELDD